MFHFAPFAAGVISRLSSFSLLAAEWGGGLVPTLPPGYEDLEDFLKPSGPEVPPSADVTINSNLSAVEAVSAILDFLLTMGQMVGGGVLIYAFISFGLSIAQENPDQRARAITYIVAGAMLVGIKPLLKQIGLISY